jgi:hypothetical protein
VAASRDRLLRHRSLSYLILLRVPRRSDPPRTFIAHERTPIDRGAAIDNNVVRSTTVGDTKLGGWSERARERRTDSPDVSIHLGTRRRDTSA